MLPEFYLDHGIWGDEKVKVKHGASRSNKLGVVLELLQPEIVYSDGGAFAYSDSETDVCVHKN